MARADAVADDWVRMTFGNDATLAATVKGMMLVSREAAVDSMTPLGLHHLMAEGHHYGPGPWVDTAPRADWNSTYYHRADARGLGFDRSATGSNAVAQYAPPVAEVFGDVRRVPENLLLWFHHVGWDHRMASGRTLWEELVFRYHAGVARVRGMQTAWRSLEGKLDAERHAQVRDFLAIQEKEARWWRDASVLYFQTFSARPIPEGYERPEHDLAHYRAVRKRYVPGIRE
jgi:alpha-glucuronidase